MLFCQWFDKTWLAIKGAKIDSQPDSQNKLSDESLKKHCWKRYFNVWLKSKSTKRQQKANLQDAEGLPWAEISRCNTQLQQTQVAPLPVVGFTLKWFQYTSYITTENSEYLQVTIMQKPRQQQQNDYHNNNGKCKNQNDNQKCKKHNNNDNIMSPTTCCLALQKNHPAPFSVYS